MENYKISKEQIEQLHNNAKCNNGQTIIEELTTWFPEAFEPKQLIKGTWYKTIKHNILFCFIGGFDEEGYPLGYGFLNDGNWYNSSNKVNGGWAKDNLREATTKEIEEALIREAEGRGYGGNYLKCIEGQVGSLSSKLEGKLCYYSTSNRLMFHTSLSSYTVFMDGEWAEVVRGITRKEAEEKFNCKIID